MSWVKAIVRSFYCNRVSGFNSAFCLNNFPEQSYFFTEAFCPDSSDIMKGIFFELSGIKAKWNIMFTISGRKTVSVNFFNKNSPGFSDERRIECYLIFF
ncbi:MAG: hypothetical protein PWQ06_505 [Anaerophaga sp.]|nr:hypothetical protein [Anaerophaga sp.]